VTEVRAEDRAKSRGELNGGVQSKVWTGFSWPRSRRGGVLEHRKGSDKDGGLSAGKGLREVREKNGRKSPQ